MEEKRVSACFQAASEVLWRRKLEITLKLICNVIPVARASYLLQKVDGVLQHSSEQLRVPSDGEAWSVFGTIFRIHAV